MPEVVASKLCTVCGVDCSGRPRVKDQQGRYMCQDCFDKAKQTKHIQKAPLPPPQSTVADKAAAAGVDLNDNSFLLTMSAAKTADTPGARVCTECGRGLSANAVVCIGCGFNVKTGKRLELRVEKAKKRSGAADAAASYGGTMVGALMGGVGGGGVGAGIWMAVAHFANLEVGYIAWAVGGLTGAGCSIGARDGAGNSTGLMACGLSLAAIGVGKYAAASMVLKTVDFANLLTPFDILWAVLALGTAWRVGSMSMND